jgi:hypothetical protein
MNASTLFKSGELSGDVRVKVGRDLVSLTHLDKVYWPDEGYTKGDLVRITMRSRNISCLISNIARSS